MAHRLREKKHCLGCIVFVFWFEISMPLIVGFKNVDSFSRLTSGETTRLR